MTSLALARTWYLQLFVFVTLTSCAWTPEGKKARYLEAADGYYDQEQYREAIIEYRNVLLIEEDHPRATQRLGLAHFQMGQLGQAYRYLQKSRELDPADNETRLKLATIHVLANQPVEAKSEASYVLEQDPKNLDALIIMAGAAETPEEVDAALAQLELVRADYSNDARFHLAVGDTYIKKRDIDKAEEAYKTAAEVEPDSIHAHLALGSFFIARRNLEKAEEEFKRAADLAPKDSVIQIRLVDFYLLSRKNEEAKTLLRGLTEEVPDFLPAWLKLAELAFSERDYEEAARALDIFIEKSPNNPDALELRGRIHFARGERTEATEKFREAINILQQVVKRRPNVPSLHYRLAQAHLRLGELVQAERELEEVRRLAPDSIPGRLLLAEMNLRTGDVDKTIENVEDLVEDQPNAQAYQILGAAYLRKRDLDRALEAYQEAVALVPNDHESRHSLGVIYRAKGDLIEAQRQFEMALSLAPGQVEPLAQLVAMAVLAQQPNQAIVRIQKQIDLVPNSGAHHYLLGSTYLAMRDQDRAIDALIKATQLEPRLLGPYARIAGIYAATGQFDEAVVQMKEAAAQNPDDVATLMILGMLYHGQGDTPNARDMYETILEIQSDFAPAANNLAYILAEEEGNFDKALQLAETARGADPDNPQIADTLGWILYRRGTYDRAVSLLKEAATKMPDNAEIQYHLGMTHFKLNQHEEAWLALKRALELSSDFPGANEARDVYAALEKIR
jgi:tetratricopeptide (TPR) repeat protein